MDTKDLIFNLIAKKGLKQGDFASAISVKEQVVSDWKAGRSKSYKKYIDKIADYLGVQTDYLLGRTDDPVPMSKPDILYKRPDGSFIFLETKGINTPLSPEQEDKVYKLLEVAMPELLSDTNN